MTVLLLYFDNAAALGRLFGFPLHPPAIVLESQIITDAIVPYPQLPLYQAPKMQEDKRLTISQQQGGV